MSPAQLVSLESLAVIVTGRERSSAAEGDSLDEKEKRFIGV